jgi:hypothetical protein
MLKRLLAPARLPGQRQAAACYVQLQALDDGARIAPAELRRQARIARPY